MVLVVACLVEIRSLLGNVQREGITQCMDPGVSYKFGPRNAFCEHERILEPTHPFPHKLFISDYINFMRPHRARVLIMDISLWVLGTSC